MNNLPAYLPYAPPLLYSAVCRSLPVAAMRSFLLRGRRKIRARMCRCALPNQLEASRRDFVLLLNHRLHDLAVSLVTNAALAIASIGRILRGTWKTRRLYGELAIAYT